MNGGSPAAAGNKSKAQEVALWASAAAFFASLLAIGVLDILDASQWAEYLGAIIVGVITAGAVYSRERLSFARQGARTGEPR